MIMEFGQHIYTLACSHINASGEAMEAHTRYVAFLVKTTVQSSKSKSISSQRTVQEKKSAISTRRESKREAANAIFSFSPSQPLP